MSEQYDGVTDRRSSERREFPRRDSGCVVSVHRPRDGGPWNPHQVDWIMHASPLTGDLVDISLNGVAFLLPERLEPGERILLRIANLPLGKTVDVRASVLRSSPEGYDEWKAICRFDRKLEFEQIVTFSRPLFESSLV